MIGASIQPAIVNKLLQRVINDSSFNKLALSKNRKMLTILVECLFKKHPYNSCQPSHVTPILSIYGGTTSDSDLRILSIFRLFEEQRRLPVSSLLARWRPTYIDMNTDDMFSAISSLDPIFMFRSCHLFPHKRTDIPDHSYMEQKEDCYDPYFALSLLNQSMANGSQINPLRWVELLRTNIFSLTVRCLSVRDLSLRRNAYILLGSLWERLKVRFCSYFDMDNVLIQHSLQSFRRGIMLYTY